MIVTTMVLVLLVGPLLLGLAGLTGSRHTPAPAPTPAAARWHWKPTVLSALLYVLAFNLTFFIQELFLVLPKAFTPGLRPTLFHNNHHWEGENPLASLFQGTGALAIAVAAVACAVLLRHGVGRSLAVRLFVIWMTYCGFFMALPQVVIGALSAHSDVGMAMAYLGLGTTAMTVSACLALIMMPPIALGLGRAFLGLAEHADDIGTRGARTRLVFQLAILPALIAIPLIIAFRVPREWIEVVVLPAVVTVIGLVWIQAGAWCLGAVYTTPVSRSGSIKYPLIAVVLLLLVFQLLLRPGIRFY